MAGLVDAVVLAVEMEPPVRIKITIGGQGAQLEQGLASSQAQSRSGEIESVGDQVTARALALWWSYLATFDLAWIR